MKRIATAQQSIENEESTAVRTLDSERTRVNFVPEELLRKIRNGEYTPNSDPALGILPTDERARGEEHTAVFRPPPELLARLSAGATVGAANAAPADEASAHEASTSEAPASEPSASEPSASEASASEAPASEASADVESSTISDEDSADGQAAPLSPPWLRSLWWGIVALAIGRALYFLFEHAHPPEFPL